jgi:predicted nucleotidyltransferase
VRRYLQNLQIHGLPVSFAVLYGSQATGRAGLASDIDLLVVSPRFDSPALRPDVDLLWRLAARTDNRIEPVPCGEHQWWEDRVSPLIEMARREGERVSIGA